jgi:hypothetical protein
VPLGYITALSAMSAMYVYVLSPSGRHALVEWASTDLANLESDPIGTLMVSAFVAIDSQWVWIVLAVVALFPLAGRFGNLRAASLVTAAHVVGTLVSEGIVAWRIGTGALPESDRYLEDVGPSYVVASALVAVILYGPGRWWRLAAAAGFAVLAPYLFVGITKLDVGAVGHVVSMTVGAVAGGCLYGLAGRRPAIPRWAGRVISRTTASR